eukprot:m.37449 g.37449  ORF g.37449 m.37449 type:complete len:73 (+) comp32381_c0_seq1:1547-1765(+)
MSGCFTATKSNLQEGFTCKTTIVFAERCFWSDCCRFWTSISCKNLQETKVEMDLFVIDCNHISLFRPNLFLR